ncbi:hypothetical protein [Candidatus Methanomassiliicoccus intestinalis]|uniref:hypothetical protein n=1 Tax=Candidatus Methanomassiliicoccus intestinalis TaxID=1406512 RepID=UPI0037DC3D78
MNDLNAIDMVEEFITNYEGLFGGFIKDDESSENSASAISHDGDNVNVVQFEISGDVNSEFNNRKAFIESKRKRLGPMGKLQTFEYPCDFTESFGGILNFKLLGKSGGFFFYTAYKNKVLLFIQAYSTNGKGQISDEERNRLIDAACKTIKHFSSF